MAYLKHLQRTMFITMLIATTFVLSFENSKVVDGLRKVHFAFPVYNFTRALGPNPTSMSNVSSQCALKIVELLTPKGYSTLIRCKFEFALNHGLCINFFHLVMVWAYFQFLFLY